MLESIYIMRCPRCEGELTVPELYCPLCGIRFQGCVYCHELFDTSERFCPFCGRPVARSYSFDDMDDDSVGEPGDERLSRLEIGNDTPVMQTADERFSVKALSEEHAKAAQETARRNSALTNLEARKTSFVRGKSVVPREDGPWEPDNWWFWWFPWPWWDSWGYHPYYYHPAFYLMRIVAALIILAFFFIYTYPQFIAYRAEGYPGTFPSWMLTWPFIILAGTILMGIVYGLFTWLMFRARKRQ